MFLFGCYNKRTKIDKVYCLGLHHFINENTICLCRKGIYELMVESSSTTMTPDVIKSAGILAILLAMGLCSQV